MTDQPKTDLEKKEALAKQRVKVVCICNGINLGQVMKGIPGSTSVEDVNNKVGTGSGGCKGERCGPRIELLLKMFKQKSKK